MSESEKFFKLVLHPIKFRLFLLSKLPSAFFSGLRVISANRESCRVSVPYKWFTKNPFRSTYFACHSMAAEMSTGVLAMAQLYKSSPWVSMLVLKVDGEYLKKAIGKTIYTCADGLMIQQTIKDAMISGDAKMVTAKSYGRNEQDEIVAQFSITWSFKSKSPKN